MMAKKDTYALVTYGADGTETLYPCDKNGRDIGKKPIVRRPPWAAAVKRRDEIAAEMEAIARDWDVGTRLPRAMLRRLHKLEKALDFEDRVIQMAKAMMRAK